MVVVDVVRAARGRMKIVRAGFVKGFRATGWIENGALSSPRSQGHVVRSIHGDFENLFDTRHTSGPAIDIATCSAASDFSNQNLLLAGIRYRCESREARIGN
jgi:hypothetical protein